MKKRIVSFLLALFLLTGVSGAALAESPRFVTIAEWMDAKGECGDCLLLVKIYEVINPVLAVGIDETGSVNLFPGGEDGLAIEFIADGTFLEGYWMVIENPRYNEFEGTPEMAGWKVLRVLPPYPSAGADAP